MELLIRELIIKALKETGLDNQVAFKVEVPQQSSFGDYSTNIAMVLAPLVKIGPQQIAEKIVSNLKKSGEVKTVDIAGPGFINISLNYHVYYDELRKILNSDGGYGKTDIGKNQKLQVEFISANPTGPLHIGNARGGPIGQALANLFSFLNYDVTTEFYINDIGGQINRFTESLYYWYAIKFDDRISFPDGGYPGEYMKEISEKIQKEKEQELSGLKDKTEILKIFEKEGLYYTIKNIREDAELLGIRFDSWVNQSDFEFSGKTDKTIERLSKVGATANKEGALWFKNPLDPDLMDRECVLRKSDDNKSLTYFADDIAYHVDKFERGFTRIIDVWGANHSGHVPRLKSALSLLKYPPEKLEIILYQYVRLKNSGRVVSMGKRLGNFVTIPQILESGVEPDAFKYFILAQNPNTPFDFDLELAADTSEKNPVFYVKYAHARICSILKKAEVDKHDLNKADLSLLVHKKELALLKEITRLPEVLVAVSENYQIQILPHYVYSVAQFFHDFYANCQVLTEDKKLMQARISLIVATKEVLANALLICGIEAPESM